MLVFNADENSLQVSHDEPGTSQLASQLHIAVLKVYGLPEHTDQAVDIPCDMIDNNCKIDGTFKRITYTVPQD